MRTSKLCIAALLVAALTSQSAQAQTPTQRDQVWAVDMVGQVQPETWAQMASDGIELFIAPVWGGYGTRSTAKDNLIGASAAGLNVAAYVQLSYGDAVDPNGIKKTLKFQPAEVQVNRGLAQVPAALFSKLKFCALTIDIPDDGNKSGLNWQVTEDPLKVLNEGIHTVRNRGLIPVIYTNPVMLTAVLTKWRAQRKGTDYDPSTFTKGIQDIGPVRLPPLWGSKYDGIDYLHLDRAKKGVAPFAALGLWTQRIGKQYASAVELAKWDPRLYQLPQPGKGILQPDLSVFDSAILGTSNHRYRPVRFFEGTARDDEGDLLVWLGIDGQNVFGSIGHRGVRARYDRFSRFIGTLQPSGQIAGTVFNAKNAVIGQGSALLAGFWTDGLGNPIGEQYAGHFSWKVAASSRTEHNGDFVVNEVIRDRSAMLMMSAPYTGDSFRGSAMMYGENGLMGTPLAQYANYGAQLRGSWMADLTSGAWFLPTALGAAPQPPFFLPGGPHPVKTKATLMQPAQTVDGKRRLILQDVIRRNIAISLTDTGLPYPSTPGVLP